MAQRNTLFSKSFVIDPTKGFLPPQIPLSQLASCSFNDKMREIARTMPSLLARQLLRSTVQQLEIHFQHAILEVHNLQQEQYALLMLTMIAQAYLRENPEHPANTLPTVLSRNIHHFCNLQQRPYTLTYRDYILHNWQLIDERNSISLENIKPVLTFTHSEEETWFIKIHVAVEAACAKALYAAQQACLLKRPEDGMLMQLLQDLANSLEEATQLLNRMQEGCSSHFFLTILQPLFEGWDQIHQSAIGEGSYGVKLNGVNEKYYRYKGISSSQSSIILALDAALGITYPTETSQHQAPVYMPHAHMAFVSHLKNYNILSKITHNIDLVNAWEAAREQLKFFRIAHSGFVEVNSVAFNKIEKSITSTNAAPRAKL